LGSYRKIGTDEGRAVYKKDDIYLHYVNDVAHKFEAWIFSSSADDLNGEVVNEDTNDCADATGATWEILDGNSWTSDPTAMVTCDGNAACCTGIVVSSTGGISELYPEMLGTYMQDFDAQSDHPLYTKDGHTLFFLTDVLHHFEGWTLSDSDNDIGPITNEGQSACAEKAQNDWEYLDVANNEWKTDVSLTFDCVDIAQCCDSVSLSSSGAGQQKFPDLMATYTNSGKFENGRPVYSHSNDQSIELKYVNDVTHHWSGWVVGEGMGSLSHDADADCPDSLDAAWDVSDGAEDWLEDATLSVKCN